ncbi:MAG: alanine racemase [Vicinamibacterales bacterium]
MPTPAPTFTLPEQIDTPTPVVDVDALDRNIASMASLLRERGVKLRPHTKTSKCLEIIRRQVNAGVVGLTVATLGEAEALADAGFTTLFQAYPVWAGEAGARTTAAGAARADQPDGWYRIDRRGSRTRRRGHRLLAAAARARRDRPWSPQNRRRPCRHPPCRARGNESRPRRCRRVHVRRPRICRVRRSARCSRRRGAGAGGGESHPARRWLRRACAERGEYANGNALRSTAGDRRAPWSYVFQDCQQVALGSASPDSIALVVAATVVASHADGRFVLDAGSKTLSSDRPVWLSGFGIVADYPDAVIRSLSEHHAVAWTTGARPRVGEIVRVVPNHCCVVVNLCDQLTVVQGGEVVDHWRVVSRGLNS